ncbi:MAG: PqqD family peptide modification chaperone [Kaiparowitsia implicata GSE-PSE-MK54-09C]|nr:PqqD family peptide modification chaperone [Kaiparowitsia implicata GSE-PSE-MK54-09C]
MLNQDSIVKASSTQVASDLGGETIILNLKSGTYYGLNKVGTRVWTLLQSGLTIKQIYSTLLEEYEVESEQCMVDLLQILNNLQNAGLIEVGHAAAA